MGDVQRVTGSNESYRYSALHAGKAMYDYINRVDMINTRIGEIERSKNSDFGDLKVNGVVMYKIDDCSSLLTKSDPAIDISDKFTQAFDKTAIQLVNEYCVAAKISDDETVAAVEKIRKINDNKLLVVPIKTGSKCYIDMEIDGKLEKNVEMIIKSIKWISDPDTYKLNCTLYVSKDKKKPASKDESAQIPICDYIKRFRLATMSLIAKSHSTQEHLITITDYGFIKPILVKDKNCAVAVDGSYVYYINNNNTSIIGGWSESGKLIITSDIKNKPLKVITDNVEFISSHRSYIVPFGLLKPTEIEA